MSCVRFGHTEAVWFLWECLRASGGLQVVMWHLAGNVRPWDRGWWCCRRGLALPSGQSIEDIKWTLPVLAATPPWQVFIWAWLGSTPPTDDFNVVKVSYLRPLSTYCSTLKVYIIEKRKWKQHDQLGAIGMAVCDIINSYYTRTWSRSWEQGAVLDSGIASP